MNQQALFCFCPELETIVEQLKYLAETSLLDWLETSPSEEHVRHVLVNLFDIMAIADAMSDKIR